jgi:hypothetical protein
MAGLLANWNVNDPLRDQKLQAAREIGWNESSGLLPGEWAKQNNLTGLYQANKYATTRGKAGTLDGWGGGGVSMDAGGNVKSQTSIDATTDKQTTSTTSPTASVTTGGGGVRLGNGTTSATFSNNLDARGNVVAPSVAESIVHNGQNYTLLDPNNPGAPLNPMDYQGRTYVTGYQQPAAPAAAPAAGPGYTERNESTEGRVYGIIDRNSPLMQQAEARALMLANRRGLANSSIAGQAMQAAVMDSALPIASQDASQAFQRNLSNQNFEQSRTLQQDQIDANIFMQGRDLSSIDWRAQLSADTQTQIANMQVSASDREKVGALVASAQQQFAETQRSILNNEAIPADVRDQYLKQAEDNLRRSLNMVESMYSVKFDWSSILPADTASPQAATQQSQPAAGEQAQAGDASWVDDYYNPGGNAGDGDGGAGDGDGGAGGSGGDGGGSGPGDGGTGSTV